MKCDDTTECVRMKSQKRNRKRMRTMKWNKMRGLELEWKWIRVSVIEVVERKNGMGRDGMNG